MWTVHDVWMFGVVDSDAGGRPEDSYPMLDGVGEHTVQFQTAADNHLAVLNSALSSG